jgi:CRP-like cAMP-binding protein
MKLTQEKLDAFYRLWNKHKKVKRNELIVPRGTVEQYVYFVNDGSLRILYETENQEIVVGFGYTDTLITDIPSFLTGKPSDFYIQAIKETELTGISKEDLMKMVAESPEIAIFWNSMIQQGLLGQIEREIDLLTNSPEERYQRLLKRSPHIFQIIPSRHIASYLRMTPETLSRLKKP